MAGLRADSQGFLLGQRRIREGVQAVFADTQEILRILQGGGAIGDCTPNPDTLADAIRRASTRRTRTINRPPEPIDVRVTVTVEGQATDVSGQAGSEQGQGNGQPARRQNRRRSRQRRTRTINRPPSDSPIDSDAGDAGGAGANGRQRDARGRFTRDGSSGEADADSKRRKFVASLAKAIGDRFDKSNSDLPDQVDPLIDAYKETKTLLAPVGKVASLAGAVFKLRGKETAKKRNDNGGDDGDAEEGSGQESRGRLRRFFNRRKPGLITRILKSNVRQEKLLTKILKQLKRPLGGGGNGGGLGGFGLPSLSPTVLAGLGLTLGAGWLTDNVKKWNDEHGNPIGEAIARTLAFFGNDEAQDAVTRQDAPQKTMDENRDKSQRYGTGDFRGVPYAPGTKTGSGYVPGSYAGNDRQLMLYDIFRQKGLSDGQASYVVEQIGREGSFLDKNLFGTHKDDSNGLTNVGMISWQREDRAGKLLARLRKKNLLNPDGSMVKSKETLMEQADFLIEEMKERPIVNREFLSNPNVTQGVARRVLGDNLIAWRRTDPRYGPSGNRNMDIYSKRLEAKLAGIEKKPSSTSSTAMDADAENIRDQGKPKKFDRYGSALIPKPKLANLVAPTGATIDFNKALPLLPIPPEPAKPPKPPKVEMPVSSPKPQVVTLAPNGDTISQNVSDRLIAHAVTGGLGMDRWDG